MSSGLFPDMELIERFTSGSISAASVAQVFVAPVDLDVVGMTLYLVTAPGSTNSINVNISDFPTSQQGGSGTTVSAYNLWTAANVPTVTGTAHSNQIANQSVQLVENQPYALNYPLPGQSPTTGYKTAQSTAQTTQTAVTSPPIIYNYAMTALVAPDNTYTDYNGLTQPASWVHAGDILTFVVAGASPGSAANLEMVLYAQKH
jgi:hypothetical protein